MIVLKTNSIDKTAGYSQQKAQLQQIEESVQAAAMARLKSVGTTLKDYVIAAFVEKAAIAVVLLGSKDSELISKKKNQIELIERNLENNNQRTAKVTAKKVIRKTKKEQELRALSREYLNLVSEKLTAEKQLAVFEKEKEASEKFAEKYGIEAVYQQAYGKTSLISIMVDDSSKLYDDETFKRDAQPLVEAFERRFLKEIVAETENLKSAGANKAEKSSSTPANNANSGLEVK